MIATIAILTLIDIICTGVGVSMGYIGEGNPLAAWMFHSSIVGTCVFVAALVGLCLWLVSRYIDAFRWVRPVLWCVIGIKSIVVFAHAIWIFMLLSM